MSEWHEGRGSTVSYAVPRQHQRLNCESASTHGMEFNSRFNAVEVGVEAWLLAVETGVEPM